ncbi:hypothetical protein [Bacillus solitudinis]|uniref:hypothetical protein n=1 Tax=Bacillus solitudinis TaxID=2014074 RepID=UPI000C231FE5|nr:hypothetical protein [Bacillus solitudinis]
MIELEIKVSQEVAEKLNEIAEQRGVTINDAATLVLTQYSNRYINLIKLHKGSQENSIEKDGSVSKV